MKEDKVIIPLNELEGYRKNQKLEENVLSKFINKRKGNENFKDASRELDYNETFKELLYTIYQPKNMVIFKGVLSSDRLIEQVLLSSEYLTTALATNENALELKVLKANRPEDYGLYYLESGGVPEIIGTNLILSKEGLFTLLCLADSKRYKRTLSFLMHQVEDRETTVKELQNISQENIAFKDPRWIGGFFVGKWSEKLEDSINKGLEELEKVQFLKVKKGVVEFTEEGEILLSLLERRQVLLSYENYYLESKDKIIGESLYFIKTDNGLFLIQEVDGAYSFTSIDMNIAKEVLETIFQVVDIIEEPNVPLGNETVQIDSFVDDKLRGVVPENKETKVAVSQNEDPKNTEKTKGTTCPSCGTKVHGNSKFCNNCGTELKKQPKKEPKVKYCYKCGNEISGTGKFCRHCGAQVLKSEI